MAWLLLSISTDFFQEITYTAVYPVITYLPGCTNLPWILLPKVAETLTFFTFVTFSSAALYKKNNCLYAINDK